MQPSGFSRGRRVAAQARNEGTSATQRHEVFVFMPRKLLEELIGLSFRGVRIQIYQSSPDLRVLDGHDFPEPPKRRLRDCRAMRPLTRGLSAAGYNPELRADPG